MNIGLIISLIVILVAYGLSLYYGIQFRNNKGGGSIFGPTIFTNSIDGDSVSIGGGNGGAQGTQGMLRSLEGEGEEKIYTTIGFGSAIDKVSMIKWLNPNSAGWTDGNGKPIILKANKLRTQQGFMPPSFSYYPEGQNSQTYNPGNYENGRNKCMEACDETGCIAVQTEIPENCYNQIISTGVEPTGVDNNGNIVPTNIDPENPQFKNTCGQNATHSCALFYKNINEADDAFFNLFQKTPENIGLKYYEDTNVSESSPSNGLPSLATVKWCPSTITEPDIGSSLYASVSGSGDCSCTNEQICDDSKCCKMRNLLTTEFVKNKIPFYNLPMKVEEKTDVPEGVCKAVNVDSQGNESCCGICDNGEGGKKIVSCLENKCIANNESNCWHVDTDLCDGDLFTEDKDAMTDFLNTCTGKDAFDCSNEKSCSFINGECIMVQPYDFTPLMNSCFYRNQGCIPLKVQAKVKKSGNVKMCKATETERGCFGSPNILVVENVGEISACSNNSIIPARERCVNDPPECQPTVDDPEKCLCKGFPYGCGTNFGSNRLWVKS